MSKSTPKLKLTFKLPSTCTSKLDPKRLSLWYGISALGVTSLPSAGTGGGSVVLPSYQGVANTAWYPACKCGYPGWPWAFAAVCRAPNGRRDVFDQVELDAGTTDGNSRWGILLAD